MSVEPEILDPRDIVTIQLPRRVAAALGALLTAEAGEHATLATQPAGQTVLPFPQPDARTSKAQAAACREAVYAAVVQAGPNGISRPELEPIAGSEGKTSHALKTLETQERVFRVGASTATRYIATCNREAWEQAEVAAHLAKLRGAQ